MDLFADSVWGGLTTIGGYIGPTFIIIFSFVFIYLFSRIGIIANRLSDLGCESGIASKIKNKIDESPEYANAIHKGQVSDSKYREELLAEIIEKRGEASIFEGMLDRFLARPVQNLENQPSLQSLSVEFATITKTQREITGIKTVSACLPAAGLFGTLMGMYSAFMSNLGAGSSGTVDNLMSGLFNDFGKALMTTILAILIRIAADLLCYFLSQRSLDVLKDELLRLKYYIFDIIEQPSVPAKAQSTNAVIEEVVDNSFTDLPQEDTEYHRPAESQEAENED
jgi:biopolymer transport protein ExbB/TolQ